MNISMVELILDVCAMVAEVALGGQGHSFCGDDSVVVVMWVRMELVNFTAKLSG